MVDKKILEAKIGEAIGIEMVVQKAVEGFNLSGSSRPEFLQKLNQMREKIYKQESRSWESKNLTRQDLDEKRIEKISHEIFDKTMKMIKIYLGNSPEPKKVLRFLSTTEGA